MMKIYTTIVLSILIDNKKAFKEKEYIRFLTNEGIFRIKKNDFYKYEIEDETSIYSEYCIIDNSIKNLIQVYTIPYPNIKEYVQELYYKINDYEIIVEYVNGKLNDYYFINIDNIQGFNEFLISYT
jgi:hypothetical protein